MEEGAIVGEWEGWKPETHKVFDLIAFNTENKAAYGVAYILKSSPEVLKFTYATIELRVSCPIVDATFVGSSDSIVIMLDNGTMEMYVLENVHAPVWSIMSSSSSNADDQSDPKDTNPVKPNSSGTTETHLSLRYVPSVAQVWGIYGRERRWVTVHLPSGNWQWYALSKSDFTMETVAYIGPCLPSLFQSHGKVGTWSVLVAGSNPTFGLCRVGGRTDRFVEFEWSKVATAMVSSVSGWWNSKTVGNDNSAASSSTSDQDAPSVTNVAIKGYWEDDSRRKIRQLSPAPNTNGRLVAASDELGRVMLLDLNWPMGCQVIRLWKGYRNAQCGWIEQDPASRLRGLYLVIYAPVRGLVEVYKARFGPLVYSFSVPSSVAKLYQTMLDCHSEALESCVLAVWRPASTTTSSNSNDEEMFLQPILLEDSRECHEIVEAYIGRNHSASQTDVVERIKEELESNKVGSSDGEFDQAWMGGMIDKITSWKVVLKLKSVIEELSDKSACLGPEFHLFWIERSLRVLKAQEEQFKERNTTTATMPSGLCTIIWQLSWQRHIVEAYQKIKRESSNATPVSKRGVSDSFDPWIEILDNKVPSPINSVSSVSENMLTCSEFWSCFNTLTKIPQEFRQFSASKGFAEIFDYLEISSLKDTSLMTVEKRFRLLDFLFRPLLGDVFAIQSIKQIHRDLLLSQSSDIYLDLFIEWYFHLPEDTVISLSSHPLNSSPLQRWIRTEYFENKIHKEEMNVEQGDTRVLLFNLESEAIGCFNACSVRKKLVHAYLLAHHCAVAENTVAIDLESKSIGKVISSGSDLRWQLIQQCILHTMFLSIRLGSWNNLSVEDIENVDSLFNRIAKCQLKSSRKDLPTTAALTVEDDDKIPMLVQDLRVSCAPGVKEIVSAYRVLELYPQLNKPDVLNVYRVLIIAREWQKDRSKMHLLGMLVQDLGKLVTNWVYQGGVALLLWKEYLCDHALDLMQFWERDTKASSINKEAALQLFGAVHSVLSVLKGCIKKAEEMTQENDEEDSDDAISEESDEERYSLHRGFSTRSSVKTLVEEDHWVNSASKKSRWYENQWPAINFRSNMFLNSISEWKKERLSLERVVEHLRCIRLLSTFVKSSVTPVRPSDLFLDGATYLCRRQNSLSAKHYDACQNKHSPEDLNAVISRQKRYIRSLLRLDSKLALDLAKVMGLDVDAMRCEHVIYLFQSNQDVLAEEYILPIKNPKALGAPLARTARKRLRFILKKMRQKPEFAPLMTTLAADSCKWIHSDAPPLNETSIEDEVDESRPSLSSTFSLLQRCMLYLDTNSVEFTYTEKMAQVAKALVQVANNTK